MYCGLIPSHRQLSATMSLLSMVEARLPPGFRFHPRDDELICDYLAATKIAGDGGRSCHACPMMVDVDLNKCEPWDLPAAACVGGKEWYFFSLRDRKYATGQRTNRATISGYWKATGKDRPVARKGLLVGMRKTLVFYQGRAPKGKKTDWVMHEFRVEGSDASAATPKFPFKEDWVLCRVFYKSRSISTKASMETSHDDSGSQFLPPLMDNYITFDQTPINSEGFGQVPCFSSLAQNLTPRLPSMESSGLHQLGGDRNVLRTVLSHLTKLEGDPKGEMVPNLAGGGLVGYLAQGGGLPSTWNSF